MTQVERTTLPGQSHRLSCTVHGEHTGLTALIASAEPNEWDRGISNLVAAGYLVLVVKVRDADHGQLLDDLTRAIRFLPSHEWVAGDGLVGSALLTVCGEQRVAVGSLVGVAIVNDAAHGSRMAAALKLLAVAPELVESVEAATSSIACRRR